MNIKITSKNFDMSPAIEEYAMSKVSSLEKFLDSSKEILCEVEIGRTTRHHQSGDIYRAEVNINEPGSAQVYVAAEEADPYIAIDAVRDEAERAIVSRKTKKDTLFRKGGSAIKSLLKRINKGR